MKVILFVALLVLVAQASFTENEYKIRFSDWMIQFNRVYTNDDFQFRYGVFKANMDFVFEWNADPTHTHWVELNDFADLTVEEYRSIYLGSHFNGTDSLANAGPMREVAPPQQDIVNWANKGAVTPIKNQGQCGSCWSFSTTGSVEALNFLYTGKLNSLSEQNLMDCSTAYGPQGCNGGWMSDAMKYIIANNGIDLEQYYPYQAVQGPCRFQASWTGASMKNIGYVQGGNEGDLVNHINTQPVSVAIDASHQSFQLYGGGIYYEPACSSSALDHAVLAIGYGSDNGDYYIVKNSWGTGWGMQGYIWMSRNRNNNCGIATAGCVPLAQ